MAKNVREKTVKIQSEKDTRPRAIAKFVGTGPSKVKRVLDLIRGKKVSEALGILLVTPTPITGIVEKVLKSAIANAENNKGLNKDDLIVAACYANDGPISKRGIWRGRGGHDLIRKRSCHITIILDLPKAK